MYHSPSSPYSDPIEDAVYDARLATEREWDRCLHAAAAAAGRCPMIEFAEVDSVEYEHERDSLVNFMFAFSADSTDPKYVAAALEAAAAAIRKAVA